ncbi:hypothetical protein LAZ67_3000229 [Cordylochernes scorpioides]|uniref:Uncharacterized protein n=1 Tax=Cordylochernes scorpioides TaxID=51811 RepID=A0ABY6K624_9ARAC|nr:hypothetical protein LAZ67_3000229 [Cordylochernes scorpioides]
MRNKRQGRLDVTSERDEDKVQEIYIWLSGRLSSGGRKLTGSFLGGNDDIGPCPVLAYSPDLTPCDFFYFSKVISALKKTIFESVEAVKTKVTVVLNKLKDFQHCFQKWKSCMEWDRDHEGENIEDCCNW